MSSLFSEIAKRIESRRDRLKKSHRDTKVMIIDGMNVFIRAFSANPKLDSNGEHIGGAVGFLQTIGVLVNMIDPTRVVIVFDGKGGSAARKKLYSEYKSNKSLKNKFNRVEGLDDMEGEEASMKRQLFAVSEVLPNLPVTTLSIDYVEADDVIAYLTSYFKDEVVVVSNDRDYLQLVNDRISVYSPTKKVMYTPQVVLEKTGVWCENYALFKALVGDKSDNIKPIRGYGDATALKNFPQLSEAVKLDVDLFISECKSYEGKSKSMNSLKENLDKLELNYKLVQLSESNISASALSRIRHAIECDVDALDKLALDTIVRRYNLKESFSGWDEWVNNKFLTLNELRNRRMPTESERGVNG